MVRHIYIKTIVVFFLVSLTKIFATNYYLDATNGNDANLGTSVAQAWKNCSKINSTFLLALQPGDSILFKRGETWSPSSITTAILSLEKSFKGTTASYIVFGAYGTGVQPIISVINSTTAKALRFYNSDISYVIIQDIKFEGRIDLNTFGSAVTTGLHHIKFLRITVDGTNTTSGYSNSPGLFCAQPFEETAPDIHNTNIKRIADIEIGYSWFNNVAQVWIDSDFDNGWIHHNTIQNVTNAALVIAGGDSIKVEYNVISNNNNTAGSYATKIESQVSRIKYLTYRFNLLKNFTYSGGLVIYDITDSKIYNNTIVPNFDTYYKYGVAAIMGYGATNVPVNYGAAQVPQTGFTNNLIANNIFIGRINLCYPNGVSITYKNGTKVTYTLPPLEQTNVFKNNLFYDASYIAANNRNVAVYETPYIAPSAKWYDAQKAGNYATTVAAGTTTRYDNNYNADDDGQNIGTWLYNNNISGNLLENPNFKGATFSGTGTYDNLRIQSNSPCRGKGVKIQDGLVDLDGNPVPSTPDIGAYQYQPPKSLGLSTPNGGENLFSGSNQDITWSSSNVNNLNIYFTTDNGTAWIQIASNISANSSLYKWTVPNITSSNCKIKIICVEDPNTFSSSSSIFSISVPTVYVKVKAFLQSPFSNGAMSTALRDKGSVPVNQPYSIAPWNYAGAESVSSIPSGIVDWILIELRRDSTAASVAAKRAAFIKNNGSIVDLDGTSDVLFNSVSSGNYYIVIKHRDHLSIMSTSTVALSKTSSLYDFTTSLNKAYGTNPMIQLASGVYGMFSGDANSDGIVNVLDYGKVGKSIFKEGYLPEDVDLNGIINVLDYQKIYNNIFKSTAVRN